MSRPEHLAPPEVVRLAVPAAAAVVRKMLTPKENPTLDVIGLFLYVHAVLWRHRSVKVYGKVRGALSLRLARFYHADLVLSLCLVMAD